MSFICPDGNKIGGELAFGVLVGPSSVFKRSPVDEFQIITVLSVLPLATLPSIDQATASSLPLLPLCPGRVC